jgi:hypothetical protein
MYNDDLDYFYEADDYQSISSDQFLVVNLDSLVEPLKITSADDKLASPDDWLDTIEYIWGIK